MTDSPAVATADARRRGLDARRNLAAASREEYSRSIRSRVRDLPEMRAPRSVGAHASLAEEVDMSALWADLAAAGSSLFLPRVNDGETGSMDFVAWTPGDSLVTNRFGIGEPSGGPVDVRSLDVVLLPCVAVDDAGSRVGFGAGYYDRALSALGTSDTRPGAGPVLVGVAFEVQRLERVERRPWDVGLDVVVTETRTIRVR